MVAVTAVVTATVAGAVAVVTSNDDPSRAEFAYGQLGFFCARAS